MLTTKTNPVGVDAVIQQVQTLLHDAVIAKWGLSNEQYQCYGRAYRNKTADGYAAEVYTQAGNYADVYYDSGIPAISFFVTGSEAAPDGANMRTDAGIVFFVNTIALKPGITHRADEEIRNDVLNLIGAGIYGFTPESIVVHLENVLSEFPGSRRDDRLKYIDMAPGHCFRVNGPLIYSPTNNICTPSKFT